MINKENHFTFELKCTIMRINYINTQNRIDSKY
jgi:hypothetical protein